MCVSVCVCRLQSSNNEIHKHKHSGHAHIQKRAHMQSLIGTQTFRCKQMHLNTFTWEHTHTHKQTWCHCCLFICQSGHPESPVLKSECVSLYVCSSSSFLSDTTGVVCFTGHYFVWHMGFAPLLCPGNKAKRAASEWSPWVWCSFHHVQLSLMSTVKLGYWWGSANGVTGLSAGSLCCVLVSCPTSGSTSGRAGCYCTMSQCDRHTFCE